MAAPIGSPLNLPLVQPQGGAAKPAQVSAEQGVTGPSFMERVENALDAVDAQQKQATHAAAEFAEGKSNDIHNTMLQAQQAEISLRLVANARNRFVEMYHEVMRMGS